MIGDLRGFQPRCTREGNRAAGRAKLLDEVRRVIRLRQYSIRTEEAYVQWARRFVRFHGMRHPREMGAREVEAFQELLGHRNLQTTMIYTHVLNRGGRGVRCPLDEAMAAQGPPADPGWPLEANRSSDQEEPLS